MIFIVPSRPAVAYSTECKWSNSTIGYSYKNLTATDQTDMNLAITDWKDVPVSISLSLNANNDIYYYSVSNGGVSWDGITYYSCNLFGQMVGTTSVYINDYFTNGYVRQERQSVEAHETGHAIGLAHSSLGSALMNCCTGTRWGTYHIFVPVYDDVSGAQSLYVSPSSTPQNLCVISVADSPQCVWNSNLYQQPNINLYVTTSTTGAFASVWPGSSSVHLPGSNTYVIYTFMSPITTYRYSTGVYLAENPYDTSQRFMTIEVDDDGFKMVQSGSSPLSIASGPTEQYWYWLTLVVQNGLPAYAYAEQTTGGSGYTWLGYGSMSLNYAWSTSVYAGNGVWTDSSSNPASNYVTYWWWDLGH